MAIRSLIWDLGGVLIDWDPRYLFTDRYFDSVEKRDFFLREICTPDWNEEQDAGRLIAQAVEERVQAFPGWEPAIRDFYGRWTEMLRGPMADTVELFRRVREKTSLPCYALTNWSAELFPIALARYDFLHWFDGRVVSGEEGTRKPHAEIFQRLFSRYGVVPGETLFIDDSLRNIRAGEALGLQVHHFTGAAGLRERLEPVILVSSNS
jgi:2-haloacid dehalogenase